MKNEEILFAAEENNRYNGGDWAGWEDAQQLIETYDQCVVDCEETLTEQLKELKSYEKTWDGEYVWAETCDGGEELGYLTAWDALRDAEGGEPWLAKTRRPK
jgi:hypothetical protein